jgi:hypothetical protein
MKSHEEMSENYNVPGPSEVTRWRRLRDYSVLIAAGDDRLS